MQPHSQLTTLLLTFTALFSIVNPFSGAFNRRLPSPVSFA
jgi:hypothetical protein